MSSVKFQGHIALKIVEFDPNCAFPDCNSSLNSPMAMKCCSKLETAKKRCPIVFQGHPSNFKVTRDKTSPILTQIGRFRTIGRSQLSNPSDLPCFQQTNKYLPFCIFTRGQFWTSGFVIACICLFVCLSVSPCVNPSFSTQKLITLSSWNHKYGEKMQKTLVKIPINFGVD